MKPKILIIIEGGMIRGITTNTEMEIAVIDYDRDDDTPVSIYEPDFVCEDFTQENTWPQEDNSEIEKNIADFLYEQKFFN